MCVCVGTTCNPDYRTVVYTGLTGRQLLGWGDGSVVRSTCHVNNDDPSLNLHYHVMMDKAEFICNPRAPMVRQEVDPENAPSFLGHLVWPS